MALSTACGANRSLWQRMWAANPLVDHWMPWLLMQKGVMLGALGLAYGVTWLLAIAAPCVILGGVAFFSRWGRDVAARQRVVLAPAVAVARTGKATGAVQR